MNFNEDGLLPPGDYKLTLNEIRSSILVRGPQNESMGCEVENVFG